MVLRHLANRMQLKLENELKNVARSAIAKIRRCFFVSWRKGSTVQSPPKLLFRNIISTNKHSPSAATFTSPIYNVTYRLPPFQFFTPRGSNLTQYPPSPPPVTRFPKKPSRDCRPETLQTRPRVSFFRIETYFVYSFVCFSPSPPRQTSLRAVWFVLILPLFLSSVWVQEEEAPLC